MFENVFALQVVGSEVVYLSTSGDGHTFPSLVKAARYIRRWQARKVQGASNQLSGVYVIEAQ